MKRAPRKRHWSDDLVTLGACPAAVKYARKFKTFREAYENCDRCDWIIWLLDALSAVNDQAAADLPNAAWVLSCDDRWRANRARYLATLSPQGLAQRLREYARYCRKMDRA